jgi:capsular polysaccharide transport system ATP-binding protein
MIRVENVSKVYPTRSGPRRVLEGINLQIARGERVGIMGSNGSGKSTLIRLIGGAERPTSGRIERTMRVSWPLAFSGAFQPQLTGLDNLHFVCRIYGVDIRRALPFVEDFAELGIYLREPVSHYSGGMLARLAFAMSMAVDFDCFLIDEVLVVGDMRFHEKCRTELFEKRKDKAFIIVSHDAHVIDTYCQRVSVLLNGKMRSFETPPEAHYYYHHAYIARQRAGETL